MLKAYLNIVRWPNLVILLLLQYLLRYSLMLPLLESEGLGLLMTDFEFFVLSLSCVLIAAGGYVINDIEDEKIDNINKPEKVIVNKKIAKEQALNLYLILSFSGILGGFYLSYMKGYSYIGVMNLMISGLLYFYSTSYKCIPLLGNIIISILSALVVFIVVLPEPFAKEHQGVMLIAGVFMFYSFFITLIREIIKDIEDIDGDHRMGCNTLVHKIGVKTSKWIATILASFLLLLLISAQLFIRQWESSIPFVYVVLFIDLPLLRLCTLLIKAEKKTDFTAASFWLKIIMFTGTISLAVFNYSFNN